MSRRRVVAGALCAALLAGGLATADEPPEGPDSFRDSLRDGCQRSQALTLATNTPEWVFVHADAVARARAIGDRTAGWRTATGTINWSRPAGEDLYLTHDHHDMNFGLRPDPADDYLLSSGNRVSHGNERNSIEGEWEATKIPTWAWPQTGDRATVRGSWIWDCGHWGEGELDDTGGLSPLLPYDPIETLKILAGQGSLRGEGTELHPVDMVAVTRTDAAGVLNGRGQELSRLDFWVNGDGGPAAAVEECALFGIVNALLARQTCPSTHPIGGAYAFTLPLAKRPSGGRLVVAPVAIAKETSEHLRAHTVHVDPDEDAGVVHVEVTLPPGADGRFGFTLFAGWSNAPAAVRHRVVVDELRIVRDLDGASETNANPIGLAAEQAPSPGEWVLYASLAGQWAPLYVGPVTDGQVIRRPLVIETWLPRGVVPRVFVSGRECDEPLMDCTAERFGATTSAFPPAGELGFNDRPGRVQVSNLGHVGLALKPGTHDYAPLVAAEGTRSEDLSDSTCGGPCYVVRATLTSSE